MARAAKGSNVMPSGRQRSHEHFCAPPCHASPLPALPPGCRQEYGQQLDGIKAQRDVLAASVAQKRSTGAWQHQPQLGCGPCPAMWQCLMPPPCCWLWRVVLMPALLPHSPPIHHSPMCAPCPLLAFPLACLPACLPPLPACLQ